MFNKRHYEAIALAIQEAARTVRAAEPWTQAASGMIGIDLAVKELADMLGRDNGQFQRERFLTACQPGANVKLRTRYKVETKPDGCVPYIPAGSGYAWEK